MQRLISYILFLICAVELSAYAINKELLSKLDKQIANRELYESQKNENIRYLKQLLSEEPTLHKRYDITYRIIEEYSNFQSDSAFVYIEKGRKLADNNAVQLLENRFQYAFVCAQSGLLNESQSVLTSLQSHLPQMNHVQKASYFRLHERLYMNLKEFSENSHMEATYAELERKYNDSVLIYLDKNAPLYHYHLFKKHFISGRYQEADQSIRAYLAQIDTLSNDAARAYYHLSLLYQEGDRKSAEEVERYLIKSVMADEKSAVRQNRSLRLLAQLLYQQGDVKRAYRYLQISSRDANFYNTKLRNSQIAEVLPIIEKDYQLERDQQEFRLRTGIFIISILSLIILIFSLYLRRKRKQLSIARKELIASNTGLHKINEEMRQKNEELKILADELEESDQIKEKYVGHFLKLCSVYIQKIGEYKKMVNRKIKAGQIDDLYKITSSTQYQQRETREFYQQFDEAFLRIYPRFVEDFNALLKEDQRFTIKEEDLLNTELRIFALIRLGIKDSSQIAEFMGYTPVTIYSYRTKVKSRAIDKENFDNNIMQIKR